MALPDTETTDAEEITVPDEDVFEHIPEDNAFRPVLEELRDDGKDWGEIFDELHDAFDPVDHAACDESFVKVPEYEIKAVVPDSKATSGERYEAFTRCGATKEKALEQIRSKPEVRRIESAERLGMVKVG